MSLSFALTPEQEEFRKVVRGFAEDVIDPVADEINAQARFPVEIIRQMGGMGLFGIPFDERYDGMGGDFLTLCLAIEEIGRVDQSLGITLEAAVGLGAAPLDRFGTAEQKPRWLPPLCRGEALGAVGGPGDRQRPPHHEVPRAQPPRQRPHAAIQRPQRERRSRDSVSPRLDRPQH